VTPGASLLLRIVVVGLAGLVAVVLLLGAACPRFAFTAESNSDGRRVTDKYGQTTIPPV